MNVRSFIAQGNTVLVAGTSTPSTVATQISTANVAGCLLVNSCTQSAFVSIGSSIGGATYPTTSTAAAGMCLRAGESRIVGIPASSSYNWLSVASSAGTLAPGVFATPGHGV